MYEDHPVEVFAAGAQPHPNQNRIAVVTAAFGDGIQLYISLMEPKRLMTFRNPFTGLPMTLMGSFRATLERR